MKYCLAFLIHCLIILSLSSILFPVEAAKPSRGFLEKKYKEYQLRTDYEGMARVLKKMLAYGYKTDERYKQLGDLYFYIKRDEEALSTFREYAEWARTASAWTNLSNLLIWKKRDREGREALEEAYRLSPDDTKLTEKLARLLEYQRLIKKAEQLRVSRYKKSGRSQEYGKRLIEFYLRNSMVFQARTVMDELLRRNPGLKGSTEMKVLNVKINAWTSRPEGALKALRQLGIDKIPTADLAYSFTLAMYGGDLSLATRVLDRLEKSGKDVWDKRLKLSVVKGDPAKTRELIEKRIDETSETNDLLFALYETYKAERDVEGEVDMLERLLKADYKNPKWHKSLIKYYNYSQDYDRGIDLYEDIVDDHEDAQLALLYLSKLYMENQEFDDFYSTVELVTRDSLLPWVAELRSHVAYLLGDKEKMFASTVELLKYVKNISPEERVLLSKKERHRDHAEEEPLPEDRYLELLVSLSDLATQLGRVEDGRLFGKRAYRLLKKRYARYPTNKRLRRLLSLGVSFAEPEERRADFALGETHFSDTDFFLKQYRFLMKQGDYQQSEIVLKKLLSSPTDSEESYMTAEHTFGFVPYDLSKKLFQTIIAKDPNYSMGLKRLGQISLYTNNFQEAIFYLEKYLSVNSFDPEGIFVLGEARYFNHEPFKAEHAFQRVITLLNYPKRANYETLLVALCYLRLGKNEQALELLNSARKRDPKDISIKLNILETLVLLERWERALELIQSENLDNDKKLNLAQEVVFRSNLESAIAEEDSEIKSKLKYQELAAIVDVQLALRVKIVKHLCLEGMGMDREDRLLLDRLYKKYPLNQEVLTTIGYFYSDRGDDAKGMVYLKKATEIPPRDPVLNKGYRELKQKNSAGLFLKSIYSERVSAGEREYSGSISRVGGSTMVTSQDQIRYRVDHFGAALYKTSTISQSDSISTSSMSLGYFGSLLNSKDLSFNQNYSGEFFFQRKEGYKLSYSIGRVSPAVGARVSLFRDVPDLEEFDWVKAESTLSGYSVSASYRLRSLNQDYSAEYSDTRLILGNENYGGSPRFLRRAFEVSQHLMTYPNSLSLSLSYVSTDVFGEVARTDPDTLLVTYHHFLLPLTQTQIGASFQHDWSEFFRTTISLSSANSKNGEFVTENRADDEQDNRTVTARAEGQYLSDRLSLTGFIGYSNTTRGEKREIIQQKSTVIEEKNSATSEIGVDLFYAF